MKYRSKAHLSLLVTSGLLVGFLFPLKSLAAVSCSVVLQQQTAEVKALVGEDAYSQWLRWEQTANFAIFVKPTIPIELPYSLMPASKLNINVDPVLPNEILGQFTKGTQVLWIKHPYNLEKTVPYLNSPHDGSISAYWTASRSMALTGALRGFTLKAPTDHPHGPNGQLQTAKADTSEDVLAAIARSQHIKNRDQVLGKDRILTTLPEVLTVSEPKTSIGYVVRDARATDDGHYYLPALSIPYVGREIAKINGEDFSSFWQKNYAEILGQAKARLLLRYGLQMETPNSQNMLIQLDRNLKPTGRIVFRDVSDALFVDGVSQALGFAQEVAQDKKLTFDPHDYLRPFASNSFWRFDEAKEKSVSRKDLSAWTAVHNKAYVKYIFQELGLATDDTTLAKYLGNWDDADSLYVFLKSNVGQALMKKYSERQPQPLNQEKIAI